MKKGEKITTESLEEAGWVLACTFSKAGLEVWANGTLRIIRRLKTDLIVTLYDRKNYKKGLTRPVDEKNFMKN